MQPGKRSDWFPKAKVYAKLFKEAGKAEMQLKPVPAVNTRMKRKGATSVVRYVPWRLLVSEYSACKVPYAHAEA